MGCKSPQRRGFKGRAVLFKARGDPPEVSPPTFPRGKGLNAEGLTVRGCGGSQATRRMCNSGDWQSHPSPSRTLGHGCRYSKGQFAMT